MKDEEVILQWFNNRNLSRGTQRTYKSIIKNYTEYTGKTLSELYDEAEYDEDNIPRLPRRRISTYLPGFKAHLEEKGLSPGTINNHIACVLSFYKAFGIITPEMVLNKGETRLEKNLNELMTKEDLQRMVDAAPNPRDRALIYLKALTGLGSTELANLTVRKYLEAASRAIDIELSDIDVLLKHEDEILSDLLVMELTRQKTGIRHCSIIPPEANRAIIAYLKERKHHRNPKQHVKDLDDSLFVTSSGKKLSRTLIGTEFKRIGKIAGFKSKKEGGYSWWRPHAFRDYFISTIINAIGDNALAHYLVGHTPSSNDRAYLHRDTESIKLRYKEALPHLSIDEAKVKDVTSKEFKKIADMEKKMKLMENMLKSMLEKQLDNEQRGGEEQ